jgi:hypothetical protein
MSRRIIVAIVGFAVYFLSLADAHADRLFRRSTGEVIAVGVGAFDKKKTSILFVPCKSHQSTVYKLAEYYLQTGDDCNEPNPWGVLSSLGIDDSTRVAESKDCPKDHICREYTIDSPDRVEKVFSSAKRGDTLDIKIISKSGDRLSWGSLDEGKKLDMTVQLKEKGGKIKESATFENLKFTHIYKAYKDYKD